MNNSIPTPPTMPPAIVLANSFIEILQIRNATPTDAIAALEIAKAHILTRFTTRSNANPNATGETAN